MYLNWVCVCGCSVPCGGKYASDCPIQGCLGYIQRVCASYKLLPPKDDVISFYYNVSYVSVLLGEYGLKDLVLFFLFDDTRGVAVEIDLVVLPLAVSP